MGLGLLTALETWPIKCYRKQYENENHKGTTQKEDIYKIPDIK